MLGIQPYSKEIREHKLLPEAVLLGRLDAEGLIDFHEDDFPHETQFDHILLLQEDRKALLRQFAGEIFARIGNLHDMSAG